MSDAGGRPPSGGPAVVAESSGSRNFLWGFLALVSGAALVRGHIGATTDAGRLAVDGIVGVVFVGTVALWVWFNRHPARLEVSPDAIVFRHRGQKGSARLPRTGDLYVSTTMLGGKHPLRFLKVTGSEEAIALQMFDWNRVQEACLAAGWRFVDRSDG